MSKPKDTFIATLDRVDSNLYHTHIIIPKKIAEKYIDADNRRVICTLNASETYHAALMHAGNGDYMIMVNAQLRKKLRLNDGAEVQVSLRKDESEYGLPLPEEFKELLKQDIAGEELFHKLTMGKQRTLLYIIAKPKSSALRIRNGIVVLEHLKRNKGVINYKQLNVDMKNAI
jgi:hypothetical protein